MGNADRHSYMLVFLVLKGRGRPRFFTSGAGLAARRAQEAE